MKRAVNRTGPVRGIKLLGQRANARDQIVDRRRAKVAKRGFKRNATGFGCIPKRSAFIEPSVEPCPVFAQLPRIIMISLRLTARVTV